MTRLIPCAFILAAVAVLACGKEDIGGIQPGTVFVAARDSFFQPDTINVSVGLPVRWTNEGSVNHTVVSDSALWTSNALAPTWWFEVRFDSAGTYAYHCSLHSGMIGAVVVSP
jgi:plastocyanin